MIGSTFIYADDLSQLNRLVEDPDALDEFEHVNMDELITLDFQEICSNLGILWAAEEPVVFDEESGLAIFQVNADAIQRVIELKKELSSEKNNDIEKLEEFVRKHGNGQIYEMATF